MEQPAFEVLAHWQPGAERGDPIALLEQQNQARLPWLLPERHRRMAASALGWFRGSVAVMARDLAAQPHSGLSVQLCGNAHLLNFAITSAAGSAPALEIQDCDHTQRGPLEWDLKRLLVSLVLVARRIGLDLEEQERLARKVARSYRQALESFTALPLLEFWSQPVLLDAAAAPLSSKRQRRQLLSQLCELSDGGGLQLRHQPPLLWRHGPWDARALSRYRCSLAMEGRALLDRFQLVDTAALVIGVGSVGQGRWVVLLQSSQSDERLLLESRQLLAEGADALQAAQRVVEGQRLLQGSHDPFLGWGSTSRAEPTVWRQLRHWKAPVSVEELGADALKGYGRLCAAVLARGHVRSGDGAQLAAALTDQKRFEKALGLFAVGYADQVELDHRSLLQALATGRLPS